MLLVAVVLAFPMGLMLGLLGGGGSILTVPILVYVLDLDPKVAIPTSLLIVGVTSAIGALHHARVGNVMYRMGLVFGVFAMVGAYAGGFTAGYLPGEVLIIIFAALMLMASIALLRPSPVDPPTQRTFAPTKTAFIGIAVGVITGMVGAGGGFMIVPAMVIFGGLGVRVAIGTSLLIITMNAGAGLAGHLGHIAIDFGLAAAITGPAVLGSLLGARLSGKAKPAALRKGFAYFILLLAAFIIYKEVPALFG